jgi:hypothetical protein
LLGVSDSGLVDITHKCGWERPGLKAHSLEVLSDIGR